MLHMLPQVFMVHAACLPVGLQRPPLDLGMPRSEALKVLKSRGDLVAGPTLVPNYSLWELRRLR
ncbi:MAG: hypothetical protein KKI08_07975, partial [Armatimonadetes bacterium]|nr:hypothetical protein [Armatimonadota bacterium]